MNTVTDIADARSTSQVYSERATRNAELDTQHVVLLDALIKIEHQVAAILKASGSSGAARFGAPTLKSIDELRFSIRLLVDEQRKAL